MDEWLHAAGRVIQAYRAEYEAAGRAAEFEKLLAPLQPASRQVLLGP